MVNDKRKYLKVIAVILFVIVLISLVYFGKIAFQYSKSSYEWNHMRESCSLFSSDEYFFDDVNITIDNEECGRNKLEGLVFFDITIQNNKDESLQWILSDMKVEGLLNLNYDCGLAYCLPSSSILIMDNESTNIYGRFNNSEYDENQLRITTSGVSKD